VRRFIRRAELTWHVIAMLLFMGAIVPSLRDALGRGTSPIEGDPVMRILLGVCYLALGLLAFHPRETLRSGVRNPVLWTLLAWVMLSVLWSGAPDITFRRAAAALLATMYGVMLYVRYPFDTVLRIVGAAVTIAILLSLAAVLLFPAIAIMGSHYGGAWRGVFDHKNTLGGLSALGLVVFGFLIGQSAGIKRWIWAGPALGSVITLTFSQSATAWVIAAMLSLTGLLLALARRIPRRLLPAVISLAAGTVIPAASIFPSLPQVILGAIGKDLTLTGRVPLWRLLLPLAMDRPLAGYGFGAFWLGWAGPSAQVWAVSPWDANYAHNGYLELWLELGFVGLALGLALLALLLVRASRGSLVQPESSRNTFALLFAVYFAAFNIVETAFLESGMGGVFYWIMFVYVVLLMSPSRGKPGHARLGSDHE
jgi:exopolysaccharide production protein ExoQ